MFFNIYASFAIVSTAFLLKNFVLVDDRIDYIFSMFFSPFYSSNTAVTCSNSSYSKLVTTTMAILSYISLFNMIIDLSYLINTRTSEENTYDELIEAFWLIDL